MSAAFVIEAHGQQAGLVVRVAKDKFRFFAAIGEAAGLEGVEFKSPAVAGLAVRQALSASGGSRRRGSGREAAPLRR